MAVIAGFGLVALGLLTGPAAGLKRGIEQFQQGLGMRPAYWHSAREERLPGQTWLAVIGLVVVLLALAAWLAGY
jgi:hypothetical protein